MIKLSSLRDVIYVTSCLKAIPKAFPQADILMPVDSRFIPIVRYNSYVNTNLEARPHTSGSFPFLFGTLKELVSVYDVVKLSIEELLDCVMIRAKSHQTDKII